MVEVRGALARMLQLELQDNETVASTIADLGEHGADPSVELSARLERIRALGAEDRPRLRTSSEAAP
jgi:hypothetical protein